MTQEEAINLIADMDSNKYTAREAVALTMAIKALESKDVLEKIRAEILKPYEGFELGDGFKDGYITAMVKVLNIIKKYKAENEDKRTEERTETHACDCISRQAVIDRINKLIEVEKKQGTDEWGYGRERVNAYEAMLHMVESEYLHPSVEPEKCGDCISRKAAFKALMINGDYNTLNEVYDRLEKLPSVEPERKTGKWEYVQYDGNPKIGNWHCSECRSIVLGFEYTGFYNYCPWCGAPMEEDLV